MESHEIVFGLLEVLLIHGLNWMGLVLMLRLLPKKILDAFLAILIGLITLSIFQMEVAHSQWFLWHDWRLPRWFFLAAAAGSAGFLFYQRNIGAACGLGVLCVGGILNQLVIVLNGFKMPVVVVDVLEKHYSELAREAALSFADARLWWLADWIPGYMAVISLGDILIDGGALMMLAFYIAMKKQHV